jgi:hypothetical protein
MIRKDTGRNLQPFFLLIFTAFQRISEKKYTFFLTQQAFWQWDKCFNLVKEFYLQKEHK